MKYRLWDPDLVKNYPLISYRGTPEFVGIGFARQVRGSGKYCVEFNLGTSSPIQHVKYYFDAPDDFSASAEALEIVACCAADYGKHVKYAMSALTDYRSITLTKNVEVDKFNLNDESIKEKLQDRISFALVELQVIVAKETAAETLAKEERRQQWKKLCEEFGSTT